MTNPYLILLLMSLLGAACVGLGIGLDRMRRQRDAARSELALRREQVQRHVGCIPHWVAVVKGLLSLVPHQPLDHAFIKDERACQTCRYLASIREMVAVADGLYGDTKGRP